MELMSNDVLLRTIQKLVGNRELKFDYSSAFLFNRTALDEQRVLSLLSRASLGDVKIHREKGRTSMYSVLARSEEVEIYLGYCDQSGPLMVTAIEPLNF
jgi:hypothetical protein